MGRIVAVLTVLVFTVSVIYGVYLKEQTLEHGAVLRLELRPVDPRSLIQGDYMILDFELTEEINKLLPEASKNYSQVVLDIDDKSIGVFKSFVEEEINLGENQVILNFTYIQIDEEFLSKVATTSYFFEEGTGKKYEKAKFGEFRVSKDGEAVLVYLLDKDLKIIK
ncbi:MAG: GDYXXLXY domain-containing protein [Campylobacterales bacterium]|nr:GDYXXLXY domain-containing protein [Campylobacterales bacterium]